MSEFIRCLATSDNGDFLAALENEGPKTKHKNIHIWNFATLSYINTLHTHHDGLKSFDISTDGTRCVVGSYYRYGITMYDTGTAKEIWNKKEHKRLLSIKFIQNNTKIAVSYPDQPLKFIDAKTGASL